MRGRRRAVGRQRLELKEAVERQEERGRAVRLPRGIGDGEDELAEELERPGRVPLGEREKNEALLEAALGRGARGTLLQEPARAIALIPTGIGDDGGERVAEEEERGGDLLGAQPVEVQREGGLDARAEGGGCG